MPKISRYPSTFTPDRDQRVHVDDTALLADLEHQRVRGDERVRPGIQGPAAERLDRGVELLGHHRHLRLRQRRDA
jgi:hypothetical protein